MFIIWQKQEQFNSLNWFVPTDILLANGDEPNLILPKFARPLYFFSHQLFRTYRNKYCWMKTVNEFAFLFATFALQNLSGLDAGQDGKI